MADHRTGLHGCRTLPAALMQPCALHPAPGPGELLAAEAGQGRGRLSPGGELGRRHCQREVRRSRGREANLTARWSSEGQKRMDGHTQVPSGHLRAGWQARERGARCHQKWLLTFCRLLREGHSGYMFAARASVTLEAGECERALGEEAGLALLQPPPGSSRAGVCTSQDASLLLSTAGSCLQGLGSQRE